LTIDTGNLEAINHSEKKILSRVEWVQERMRGEEAGMEKAINIFL
jgi:hypothetical protein